MRKQARRVWLAVGILALGIAGRGTPAFGFSSGVTTEAFGVGGCNQCHSLGIVPDVRLLGPSSVAPGSVTEYTFEVDTVGSQNLAGLNVSAPDGELQVGGTNATNTQLVSLIGDPTVQEITHTGPKMPSSGTVRFSFLWQAPLTPGVTTITAWGNAVDGNGFFTNDAADSDELDVNVTTIPTGLDSYKCYQGKDLKSPKFAKLKCPAGVQTSDQFTTECVDLLKVKFICTPVAIDGGVILDPSAHLICYQIKGATLEPRPRVEVNTQFQASQFELKKPKLICVPGTKVILP
jgi:hypothetical protein